jgi:uncharacterized protein
MNYTEEATVFTCDGQTLIAVLARPATPNDIGVVVIVGGPQYRAGSHRQFVLLSRALAAAGFAVLRFDYRGMGDGEGKQRDFESVSADVAAAIDQLQSRMPAVRQVVLWGLCDGASAALLYCQETHDPRVVKLCLLNPWVRSEASLAKTQVKHYYTQRLMQREFWLKLLSGKVALGALSGFVQRVWLSASRGTGPASAIAPFQVRMATGWHNFKGQILLILSGEDYTAKEFMEHVSADAAWKDYQSHPGLIHKDLPGVDHTFSNAVARKMVEDVTLNWLASQRMAAAHHLNHLT